MDSSTVIDEHDLVAASAALCESVVSMIHPTAVIHPQAKLHASVQIGPHAVIDAGVELGAGCVVGPHVYLTGTTHIGQGNHFHAGCVIGDLPQDLKYKGAATRVTIADHNVFREHVTVNRATTAGDATVVGSHNFIMASAHIAHNCVVGNHVVMANCATLGGHAKVQDRAFLSGSCLVHQFCRVGTLAIMQGGSAISKDLPPFTVARGDNGICGLNVVGLRRAGFSAEARLELKKLYHALFRSGTSFSAALAAARKQFSSPGAQVMLEFVTEAKRGVCSDRGTARGGQEE
jgi:UDP-N-acetylglucosamine acyltransferase